MRRVAVTSIGALSVSLCATATRAQATDSAVAAAPIPASLRSRSRTTYDGWLGIAHSSPTNLFSGIAGRRLTISALHLQRPFAGSARVAWDYIAGVVPAAWVSATPRKGRGVEPDGCQFPQGCAPIIENQRRVYGFGATPAGLQLRLSPSARVQTFVSIEAGALWFNESMPTTRADRFNFMLDAGGGLLFARPDKLGFVLGYKLVHLSNGGLGRVNPGLDNHLFYAGLARVPAASLTTWGQEAGDDERPGDSPVGSARVGLEWLTNIHSKDLAAWSASGAFVPFVSEHWQLGVGPFVTGGITNGHVVHGVRLAATANLMTGGNRWKAYVGTWLGGEGGTYQTGSGLVGAQIGLLGFLAPTAALRGELRWRRATYTGSSGTAEALITIDSYTGGRANVTPATPTFGTLDVAGYLYGNFRFERARSYHLLAAPFITPWSQFGLELDHVSYMGDDGRYGSGRQNVFARLYAPLSLRLLPFAEGFVEHSTNADGNLDRWLATYGAAGGVRHYINAGTALDLGLQWRRHTADRTADVVVRPQDQTLFLVRIVTQLGLGPSTR